MAALREGEIAVLDRVPPWRIGELRAEAEIVVARYALPTVHVLIPSPASTPLQSRSLRRALLYGLERNVILRGELLAGRDVEGAAVLSGPFPVRTSFDDPLGFASDERIEPLPYDPRMAFALSQAARRGSAAGGNAPPAEKPTGAQPAEAEKPTAPPETPPALVLAHPADPIARAACAAMQAHWKRVGIEVKLLEWSPGEAELGADEYDLLYAQLAMWDPLVDARRLLGAGQTFAAGSPYLNLALRELDEAADSKQTRLRLHEIHRLVADALPVLPLWQLPEHFAYRRELSEVGAKPLTLYQNVEQWQISVRPPKEGGG
jgi:ABC-type transport system substrate-binding protein